MNQKRFILGSGVLYLAVCEGTIPEDTVLETDANRVGNISGGATLEYKPTFYRVEDDLGTVKSDLLTAEELTFKSGLLIPNMDFMPYAAPTVRTATAEQVKTTKIGGIKNADGKSYVVRFVHKSTANPTYKLRTTIVGVNTSGFSLALLKDKETVVDMTFSAEPLDDTGTLCQITEQNETTEV